MKLESKFDKGASVWFFVYKDDNPKILEAKITEVSWWDVNDGFRYDLSHINTEGVEENYQETERFMWGSKSAATAAVFEAQGTLVPSEPVSE